MKVQHFFVNKSVERVEPLVPEFFSDTFNEMEKVFQVVFYSFWRFWRWWLKQIEQAIPPTSYMCLIFLKKKKKRDDVLYLLGAVFFSFDFLAVFFFLFIHFSLTLSSCSSSTCFLDIPVFFLLLLSPRPIRRNKKKNKLERHALYPDKCQMHTSTCYFFFSLFFYLVEMLFKVPHSNSPMESMFHRKDLNVFTKSSFYFPNNIIQVKKKKIHSFAKEKKNRIQSRDLNSVFIQGIRDEFHSWKMTHSVLIQQ